MTKINIQHKTGAEVAGILLGLVTAFVLVFGFQAWIVMLVMGALHAEVAASIPAISFWASALVVLALGIVGSFFRSSK